jgi:hypothetical protein
MQIQNSFHYPLIVTMLDPVQVFQDDIRVGPGQLWSNSEPGGRVTFGPQANVVDPCGKESCLVVFDEQGGTGLIASFYRTPDPRVSAWRSGVFE